MIKPLLLVTLGGGLGSALRFLATRLVARYFPDHLPVGTLVVNSTGCFLAGLLLGLATRHDASHTLLRAFFLTGLCGGYTTFSAFSLDNISLLQQGRLFPFLLYTLTTLLVGLFSAWLGLRITSP